MKTMSADIVTISNIERQQFADQSQQSTVVSTGSTPRPKRCLPNIPTGIGTAMSNSVGSHQRFAEIRDFVTAKKLDASSWSLIRRSCAVMTSKNGDRFQQINNGSESDGNEGIVARRIVEKRVEKEPVEHCAARGPSHHVARRVAHDDVISSYGTLGVQHRQRQVIRDDVIGDERLAMITDVGESFDSVQLETGGGRSTRSVRSDDGRQWNANNGQELQSECSTEPSPTGIPSEYLHLNTTNSCLYALLYLYELHRVTLTSTAKRCHSDKKDIAVGLTEVDLEPLIKNGNIPGTPSTWPSLLGQLYADPDQDEDRSQLYCDQSVSSGVTPVSVITSVSRHLVSTGSRNVSIGDVMVEINGHYIVGWSVDRVRRLLATFINQPLHLVVASKRAPGGQNQIQNPLECSADGTSSRLDGSELLESDDPHQSRAAAEASLTALCHVEKTASDKDTNHVVSRRALFPLRRTTSDVTSVSSTGDVTNGNRRRSTIVDTRPHAENYQHIDNSSQNKLTELNCRNALNMTAVTNSSQFLDYANVSGAFNGHFGNQCHVPPMNRVDKEEKNQSETDSRKNTHQCGRVGRFQKSPHPNWLSAVLEDCTTKRPLARHCEINRQTGFVPLSVPEDDTRSTSSDDSVTPETLYYDDYGWQCVTAV